MDDILEQETTTTGEGVRNETVEELLAEIEKMKGNTVEKEKYEALLSDNKTLISSLTNNRGVPITEKGKTREEIIKECTDRTMSMTEENTLTKVTNLCKNYRDMRKLGMNVEIVDEKIVAGLEKMLEKSNGNNDLFVAHLGTLK